METASGWFYTSTMTNRTGGPSSSKACPLHSGHIRSAAHENVVRTSAVHAGHATGTHGFLGFLVSPHPTRPQDVFKPDPARLRRSLCALINFAKFREEKVALVDELEERVAGRAQEAANAEAELERNVRRRRGPG